MRAYMNTLLEYIPSYSSIISFEALQELMKDMSIVHVICPVKLIYVYLSHFRWRSWLLIKLLSDNWEDYQYIAHIITRVAALTLGLS